MEHSSGQTNNWRELLPNEPGYREAVEAELWDRAQTAGPQQADVYFDKLLAVDVARQQAEAGIEDGGEAVDRYRQVAEELRQYEGQVLPEPPDKTAPGE